jgi:hypothetical protein
MQFPADHIAGRREPVGVQPSLKAQPSAADTAPLYDG